VALLYIECHFPFSISHLAFVIGKKKPDAFVAEQLERKTDSLYLGESVFPYASPFLLCPFLQRPLLLLFSATAMRLSLPEMTNESFLRMTNDK
jgi:hypothetical protein